ncbi:MAG: flagellar motor protein MotB [Candidatus Hydrogenedentes bacterium]|nr:flagellar motor protein MotB [Candidatus Hydrogenedentota bacterium]
MSKKKAHAEEHENEERWLLTYADLITLLMVFFVVMYAMSNADAVRFAQAAASFRETFGDNPKLSVAPAVPAPRSSRKLPPEGGPNKGSGDERLRKLKSLGEDLKKVAEDRGLKESLTMRYDPKGPKLIMSLSDALLFDVGTADLTDAARAFMTPLGEVLRSQPNDIQIEGHTDNVPIQTGRYSSNFSLSTERAVNVIMYLANSGGVPLEKMSASGYGEFRPIAENDSPEGRAKNRRVEFVIYSGPEAAGDEAAPTGEDANQVLDEEVLELPAQETPDTADAAVPEGTAPEAETAPEAPAASEH